MKPAAQMILRAPALSQSIHRPADAITACNVCGKPSERLQLWRECDEHDSATARLVYVAADHPACEKRLDAHPRLYKQERGLPGTFPLLCGPCTYRQGEACRHPDLRSNGGPGLPVRMDGPSGIVCRGRGGGGCSPIAKNAVGCKGREV